ncbi:MAG: ABC transporter permease [Pseudomonadota bacterium]|nr:ABC transporter permease [Pseudomonadota bacterium]
MEGINDSLKPTGIFTSLIIHQSLIRQLAKREVSSRYRGSVMGFFWTLLNPLLMLTIYTLIFGYVFKARWGDMNLGDGSFALTLFCGLIVHGMFAECINRAPMLITSNVNYVKKVVFPIEILPWVAIYTAFFHTLMSLLVLLAFNLIINGNIPMTVLWLPVVFIPYIIFLVGCLWLFSALGVFLSDIQQLMGLMTTALLFLSPVFYPISALPESVRGLIYLNPLTVIIEQSREILLWGNPPDFGLLAIYSLVATGIAIIGFIWFQKSRRGFADVL